MYLGENLVKPLLKSEPDTAVLEANAPRFHLLAGILEERLGKQSWIVGRTVTIADIAIAAPMHAPSPVTAVAARAVFELAQLDDSG